MLRRLTSNSFIRSGALYSAASFVVSVIHYLFNLVVARSFSLADYGEYMTAVSYIFLLIIPINAFSMVVIKKIGKSEAGDKTALAIAIRNWLFSQLKTNSLYILIAVSLGSFVLLTQANLMLASVIFISIMAIVTLFTSFYLAIFQAYKIFMFASLFVFVSGLLKLLGGIIVIIGFPELTWLYLAIILAGLLAILFGHYLNAHYSRKVIASEKMSIEMTSTIEYIKRKTVYIPLLTTLGLVGLANVDIILIKKFMSGDLTGLYASLSLMGKIILYLTVPISDVAYSFFSNKDSRHQANKILLMTTLVYFFIGVVSVIGYTLFPEIIINVIFGSKFASLASVLYLSAIFGFLYSLLRLYSQYFVAQNDVWGILSIGGVLLQAVLIYLWHTSITQVFIINIGVFSLILFCFYLKLGFVYLNHNKSATRHLFGLKWL